MRDRAEAVALLAPSFAEHAAALGLEDEPAVAYRPRSGADTAEGLAGELAERLAGDLERGFTGHGPHRDELAFRRARRDLRAYGSRGQQRLALLALLLAEREVLAAARGTPPLLLLDDVMSELDGPRRRRLAEVLAGRGQAVITATEPGHVPGADAPGVVRLAVVDGAVLQEAADAAPAREAS
jgi:DNA replication and repair protein RecF